MNVFHKLAMLSCIALALAAQSVSPIDARVEGVWKLSSERIDQGSLASLPVGSVMTVARDGDHVIVRFTDEGKVVTSAISGGGPVKLKSSFSPDGKTLTQTVTGTNADTGKPYSITRVWQRQGVGSNR
jgi:hypothetical protein